MQAHHAEIPDTSPDADNLNRSDMQSKNDGEGADSLTDSGFYDTDRKISSLRKFSQNSESNTCQSNEEVLAKERSSNDFEDNSHFFVSDKNGTSIHLDNILPDANSSEFPSSENKECNNFKTEDNLVLPEDSSKNSTQISENADLNERFSADENQRHIKHRSNNEEVADQYSGTASEYADCPSESKPSKFVELPASGLAGLSSSEPARLSTSEVAELTASVLPSTGHKECSDFNSEDTSMLSEDYRLNSTDEDENTDLNLILLFDENLYHVGNHSDNEEFNGQDSETASESTGCSSETKSSKPAELPDSEPSELPSSKLVESSSSVRKECSDFQSEDTSMLSENCRMNSTQIDENRDLNLGFSLDENKKSSNGEKIADQHSGASSERDEYSSESKSPEAGIVNRGPSKRFRKKHKIKKRSFSGIKRDTSDSDSRQQAQWNSDICLRNTQERKVERPVHEVRTSECDENECHNEHHSNNEVVSDQYSGTASKGAEYSSSSESGIARVNRSENGAAIYEQTQILVPEQSEGFYTRDQAPVCSLRYKNLDVDIFPPLSRLDLKLVCQKRKTQTNSENSETWMSETSSVSQSMNSEDCFTSEVQSDDCSAEQNVSQTAVTQSSGVINKFENKPLHFEDRNVSLNYSKRRASLNYSHSSSDGNQITFKSKNTELSITTQNIDERA
ncbi:hypothetical protein AVEN_20855-1 [Araneus ventricosus]|uniref:Uncharacterized protein n=2 Tax=Araneus ventricosus TaxID=182803 RepID=A0A4Y2BDY6_ARAVE|nr:hypothetical protein AVEN_20855-1 [Araneus ventricosus]